MLTKSVIADFIQLSHLELSIIVQKVQSGERNLGCVSISHLHDILFAFIQFSATVFKVTSSLLYHPSKLLKLIYPIF